MNNGREPSEEAQASTRVLTLPVDNPYWEALLEVLREGSLLHHLNGVRLRFELPNGKLETYTVYPAGNTKEYRERIKQLNWSNH